MQQIHTPKTSVSDDIVFTHDKENGGDAISHLGLPMTGERADITSQRMEKHDDDVESTDSTRLKSSSHHFRSGQSRLPTIYHVFSLGNAGFNTDEASFRTGETKLCRH